MAKDTDRELIDRIDSAISEEIRKTLERVLSIHLKPITETLKLLEIKVNAIEKHLDRIEGRVDTIEKEQKKQGKNLNKIQKTLDLAIKIFNKEDIQLRKRVERIETHLELPRLQ